MQRQSEQQIKNLKTQTEQQIYSRIMDASLNLKVRKCLLKWQRKVRFLQRFTVVDSPDEYYVIVAFLDLFEFLFRLNKRDVIDTEIWSRWKALAKAIMTIPKFKRVWEKTKDAHAKEFIDFIDSLESIA